VYRSEYHKHDYPEEDSNKKTHLCIISSAILNCEIRQSNLRSHLTNEMSVVCIALKTTYKQRTEEPCKSSNLSLSPQSGTAAAGMAGITSCWQVTFDVNLAPGSERVLHPCCIYSTKIVCVPPPTKISTMPLEGRVQR
jgi:hypothetical protein